MRVLHIQKATGVAGSERHLLTLLPALAGRGLEVRMCVLGAGMGMRFVESLRDAGIDTSVVPAGADLNPVLVPRLIREIKGFHPDVVHTHLIHADLHGQIAARLRRVPAVLTMHGTHPFYERRQYAAAQRLAGRLAGRTICVSEHVASFVRRNRFAHADDIRVIHHGIDATQWSASTEERAAARKMFGLGPTEVVVGVASRLVAHKGHNFLLESLHRLDGTKGVRLLIAGEGPEQAGLEARAQHLEHGRVRFLGFVSEMKSFMNACDIVVFPTVRGFGEGFGLALLEAMAAARPIVATDIDSIPEIVIPGETGLLVPPGDVPELSKALESLIADADLRRAMGRRGRERALSSFTVRQMVDETVDVYRGAV